jgi:hypothetical protein
MSRPKACLALLTALAVAGCGTSSTPIPTALQAPQAPTNAVQMMVAMPTDDPDYDPDYPDAIAAEYSWTPPAGPIDGYYFFVMGTYLDEQPSTTCDASWEVLPASATSHRDTYVEADNPTYICAFNAAGTSPTVEFEIAYGPGVVVPEE